MCAECHSTNLQRNYDAAIAAATRRPGPRSTCRARPATARARNHVAWAKDRRRCTGGRSGQPRPGRAVRRAPRRELDDRRIDRQAGTEHRAGRRSRARHLRALSFAARPDLGRLHAGPSDRRHASRGAARSGALFPGRPDSRRGVRVRLVPAEPDAPGRRQLQRLPRAAQPQAARRWRCRVHDLPPGGEIRDHRNITITKPESAGSQCLECHMPGRNYMVVDHRRDHSLRVPRPDLAATTGVPDACTGLPSRTQTGMGRRKTARVAWAVAAPDSRHYAEILHAWRYRRCGCARALAGAGRRTFGQPGIARASALQRLDRITGPRDAECGRRPAARSRIRWCDARPSSAHRLVPVDLRAGLVAVLDDPVRDVRLEADPTGGRDACRAPCNPRRRRSRDRAMAEYVGLAAGQRRSSGVPCQPGPALCSRPADTPRRGRRSSKPWCSTPGSCRRPSTWRTCTGPWVQEADAEAVLRAGSRNQPGRGCPAPRPGSPAGAHRTGGFCARRN